MASVVEWARWRLRSRKLTIRIYARAGGRYEAVQPLLTKPGDYETFIRLGHMDITAVCGGRELRNENAAPLARRLWRDGELFPGAQKSYRLPGGELTTDPTDVPPGTPIEAIRLKNTLRVPKDFLDQL